jgi:hypothetical protein
MGQNASSAQKKCDAKSFKETMKIQDKVQQQKMQENAKTRQDAKDKFDQDLEAKVRTNPEKYITKMINTVTTGFKSHSKQKNVVFDFIASEPWNEYLHGHSVHGGPYRISVVDYHLMKKVMNRNFEPIMNQVSDRLARDYNIVFTRESSRRYRAIRK